MSAILNYVNQRGSVLELLFPFASKGHEPAALSTIHQEKTKKQKNRRLNETLKRYVYFLSLFTYSLLLIVCSKSLLCSN